MIVWGIDASLSSTGWCIVDNKKIIDYGKIVTRKKDYIDDDERLDYIFSQLDKITKKHSIDMAVLEKSTYKGNSRSTGQLNELNGMVKGLCNIKRIPLCRLYPTTIKKIVAGNGRASKEEVAKYIRENVIDIGEYSNKCNKREKIDKTSDIYDSIAAVIAWEKRGNSR